MMCMKCGSVLVFGGRCMRCGNEPIKCDMANIGSEVRETVR